MTRPLEWCYPNLYYNLLILEYLNILVLVSYLLFVQCLKVPKPTKDFTLKLLCCGIIRNRNSALSLGKPEKFLCPTKHKELNSKIVKVAGCSVSLWGWYISPWALLHWNPCMCSVHACILIFSLNIFHQLCKQSTHNKTHTIWCAWYAAYLVSSNGLILISWY